MSVEPTGRADAQAAHDAPAHDGGVTGGAVAAGPMACHIGHNSPRDPKDGHLTVEVWANGIKVKRPSHVTPSEYQPLRGKVNGLSPRASRRLRWAIENTPPLIDRDALFICLTYPAEWPRDGREVKRHLDTLGKRARRVGALFAWALEYQTRGAPHFHLLARFPKDWDVVRVRLWLAQNWFEVVGSGDEKHLHAGTSAELVNVPERASFYISHYLGKEYQKTPPSGVTLPGRMWGMIGCKPTEPEIYRFHEGSREGIELVRNVRRWAASDHAFRQRTRYLSATERKAEAKYFRRIDPDLAAALLDFRDCHWTAEVRPENRKRWSPHDPGREKGFSVRNAAKIAHLLITQQLTTK